jgi:hypothetical protein
LLDVARGIEVDGGKDEEDGALELETTISNRGHGQ